MVDMKTGELREKQYAASSHDHESLKNDTATGNAELDAIPDPDVVCILSRQALCDKKLTWKG